MDIFRLEAPIADIGSLESLIQDATSDMQLRPDLQANITIMDHVNKLKTTDQQGEVVRQLRLRLQTGSWNSIYLTLELTETLAKNCGLRFLKQLGDPVIKFLDQMKKIIKKGNSKTAVDAREATYKAMELVQTWGEEFLPIQSRYGLHAFVECYHDLCSKGFKFPLPQLDESRPPVFTPAITHGPNPSGSSSKARTSSRNTTPATTSSTQPSNRPNRSETHAVTSNATFKDPPVGKDKRLSREAMLLSNTIGMLIETLADVTDLRDLDHNEAIQQLYNDVKEGEAKVIYAISALIETAPEQAEPLFTLNDDLHDALKFYDEVYKYGPDAIQRSKTSAAATTRERRRQNHYSDTKKPSSRRESRSRSRSGSSSNQKSKSEDQVNTKQRRKRNSQTETDDLLDLFSNDTTSTTTQSNMSKQPPEQNWQTQGMNPSTNHTNSMPSQQIQQGKSDELANMFHVSMSMSNSDSSSQHTTSSAPQSNVMANKNTNYDPFSEISTSNSNPSVVSAGMQGWPAQPIQQAPRPYPEGTQGVPPHYWARWQNPAYQPRPGMPMYSGGGQTQHGGMPPRHNGPLPPRYMNQPPTSQPGSVGPMHQPPTSQPGSVGPMHQPPQSYPPTTMMSGGGPMNQQQNRPPMMSGNLGMYGPPGGSNVPSVPGGSMPMHSTSMAGYHPNMYGQYPGQHPQMFTQPTKTAPTQPQTGHPRGGEIDTGNPFDQF